jgi:hypothetical protein
VEISVKHSEQVKVDELRLWHDVLEDKNLSMSAPDYFVATLRTHAEVLERLGVIATQECFELKKLADEAYAHAVEFGPVEEGDEDEPA